MNYLVHIFTAGDDPEVLVGNMMGDFVKGRLDDRYPPRIRDGIQMHRKIDSFAAANSFFLQSKRRIDSSYRHYRGILVDIYYDHFLAKNWEIYSPVPFDAFVAEAYRVLSECLEIMPEPLRQLLPRMFSSNWLLSYRDVDGIDSVLKRMSRRIDRINPLSHGVSELSSNYLFLQEDFFCFMHDLGNYMKKRGIADYGDGP